MLKFKTHNLTPIAKAELPSTVRYSIANSPAVIPCRFTAQSIVTLSGETVVKVTKNSEPLFNSKLGCKGIVVPCNPPPALYPALRALAANGLVFFKEKTTEPSLSNTCLLCDNSMHTADFTVNDYEVDKLSVVNKRKFFSALGPYPPVSIVLCTSRLANLNSIVPQIIKQNYPNFEIIFVNHGSDVKNFSRRVHLLIENHAGSKRSINYKIIHSTQSSTFGHALSVGSRAASGDFIAKFDDDDFYSENHLLDLVIPSFFNDFAIIGKSLNYVYIEPLDTTFVKKLTNTTASSERLASWVAGGTMLIKKDFGTAVSWFSSVQYGVDRDIQDKAIKLKLPIYRTYGAGYVYSRTNNKHTWNTNWQKYMTASSHQIEGIYGNF